MQYRQQERDGGNLHRAVLNEIESLTGQLDRDATDKEIAEAIGQVRKIVEPIHAELIVHIEALQRVAKWDTFTIAFYGETNAGKSTTIETLRMLLGEATKIAAREQFRAIEAEQGLSEATLLASNDSIERDSSALDALRAQARETTSRLDAEKSAFRDRLNQLRERLETQKRTASIWQKFLGLFRTTTEEREYAHAAQQQSGLDATHAAQCAQHEVRINMAQSALDALRSKQTATLAELDRLSPYADGLIVGTGRSDFTRETQSYAFEANGQTFELLDVPGIEGKEADVLDNILSAVRTAHAVFYITGKAAPPQTGDEHGLGTLEKIRIHLGDQTEVWSIFNKRITNPIQLEKGELLSKDECRGIAALDETMRKNLGPHYLGHIALSAQPAFLAAAECLVPFSDLARNRAKFLARSSPEDVIARSGFQALLDKLRGSMVTDSQKRIRAANLNKIHFVVEKAADKLSRMQRETIAPLTDAFRNDCTLVDKQLDLAVGALNQSVQNLSAEALAEFQTRVRESVYGKIRSGIDNADLKSVLQRAIEREQKALEAGLSDKARARLDRFHDEVTLVLDRFKERAGQLKETYRSMSSRAFGRDIDFDMKFGSGVQYGSLLAALVGGALMIWNPAGWAWLVIGGLTMIVSIAKALWGLVSEDYKKGEQRRVTEENLTRVIQSMRDAMNANGVTLREEVDARIGEIKAAIGRSVEEIAQVNSALVQVCANLNVIALTMSRAKTAINPRSEAEATA